MRRSLFLVGVVCVAGAAGCGDDYGDSKSSSNTTGTGGSQAVTKESVERTITERLGRPGLNSVVVDSVTCPASIATSSGSSFKCHVRGKDADNQAPREGDVDITVEDGQRIRITGTLRGPAGTNRFFYSVPIAPPAPKAEQHSGYLGSVEKGLTASMAEPGVTSVVLESASCTGAEKPKEGAKLRCTISGEQRKDGDRVQGTLTVTQKDGEGRSFAVKGSLPSGPGQTLLINRKFTVPAG